MQMVWRLGLLATLWSIVSNRLLVDGVREGDALIDSIAVHPDSQGRGFGSALLKWCEATVAAEAEPGTSSNLYLWVSWLLCVCVCVCVCARALSRTASPTSSPPSPMPFSALQRAQPELLHLAAVLQVAETNAAAGMYARHGFQVVKKTRDDWSAPFMRRVLRSFLGFPDWHRMVKVCARAAAELRLVSHIPTAVPRPPQ